MRAYTLAVTLLTTLLATAQQGYLPLSRVVDAPLTARLQRHAKDLTQHSAIRPYLREDAARLNDADSLWCASWRPWMDSLADPRHRVYGAPLAELLAGGSFSEENMFKHRAGLGGWVEYAPGPRWTLHLSAMGWNEALPDYLDSLRKAIHVTPGEGYAQGTDAVMHHDWNAWADYKAGRHFHFTLGRGRNSFGEGLRSLFLSDNAYSYPYLRITTTAWRFRYVNLFAAMSDIRGAGGRWNDRALKFTSMHYLSWNALPRLNIGVFEAIVWQDNDPSYRRGFDLNYLNPVLFYRPAEYSVGSPDNALLGFAVNVRVGRRTLLYSQLMFDEFLLSNVREGRGWYANKQGLQLGVVGHDAFRVKGLTLRTEFNYVRPFMYAHSDTRQSYTHYNQPLAHPYGSNFWEVLAQGEVRRGHWLYSGVLSYAVLGQDSSTAANNSWGNNPFLPELQRPLRDGVRPESYGFYLAEPVQVALFHAELRAGRLLDARSGLMLQAGWTVRIRQPEVGEGLTTSFLRIGLSANLFERHPFQDARYALPE